MSNRRNFIAQLSALGSATVLPSLAHAQSPDLAKVLCGFPAGGTADLALVAQRQVPGVQPGPAPGSRPQHGAFGDAAAQAIGNGRRDALRIVEPAFALCQHQ